MIRVWLRCRVIEQLTQDIAKAEAKSTKRGEFSGRLRTKPRQVRKAERLRQYRADLLAKNQVWLDAYERRGRIPLSPDLREAS